MQIANDLIGEGNDDTELFPERELSRIALDFEMDCIEFPPVRKMVRSWSWKSKSSTAQLHTF